MSKSALDKPFRPATVTYIERAHQWASKIGYRWRNGRRVRDWQWLGKDEGPAKLKAMRLAQSWAAVAVDQKSQGIKLPTWPDTDREQSLVEAGTLIELPPTHEEAMELPPPTAETTTPKSEQMADAVMNRDIITLQRAKEDYLADMERRVGKAGKRGLKVSTYNQYVTEFRIALTGGKNDKKPIDTSKPLSALTTSDIANFIDYWFALPGEITEATATNYCKRFRELLKWACGKGELVQLQRRLFWNDEYLPAKVVSRIEAG